MVKIPLDIKEFHNIEKYYWLISLRSYLLLRFYSSEMCLSKNLPHRLTESDPPEIFSDIVIMQVLQTFIISKKVNKFKEPTKVFPISIKSQMAIKL